MRRSIGACEKYHGALIDHVGHEHTRVFREMQVLGQELKELGGFVLGSRVPARAAIVVDWDNWWALEYSAGPSCDLKYMDEVERYYTAFYALNIPVDLVSVEDSLEKYALVVTPVLYMVKTGYEQVLRRFVENGGTLITTFFSGIVEEHDLVITGGYPGRLRDIFGVWVEEIDALPTEKKNAFVWEKKLYPAELLCDIMHLETAENRAVYQEDFYAGTPAIVCNQLGKGRAWYVGTRSNARFYQDFLKAAAEEAGIQEIWTPREGVEVCLRENKKFQYYFFLNHGQEAVELTMEKSGYSLLEHREYLAGEKAVLEGKGVMLLKV